VEIHVILLNEKRRKINFKDDETYFFVNFLSNHSDYITFTIFFYSLYIY